MFWSEPLSCPEPFDSLAVVVSLTTLLRIVCLVGPVICLAEQTCSLEPGDTLLLRLVLALAKAVDSLAFVLVFLLCFLFTMRLMASRSRSSCLGDLDLGSSVWGKLHWLSHLGGTDLRMMPARSASLNGTLPFLSPQQLWGCRRFMPWIGSHAS